MKKRIFISVCLATLVSLLLFGACAVGITYYKNIQSTWTNLSAKAYYLSAAMEESGNGYLERVRGYAGRITLIGTDGQVLFDDRELPAQMENHADRPEIQQALQNGTGRAQRVSSTLGEQTLYYALRLSDGAILRVSATTASVLGETMGLVPLFLLVLLVLTALAAVLARRQTKVILRPINSIDLDKPFEEDAYGELSPLLRRIAAQKRQINQQMKALRDKQVEFDIITGNMDEGLVVMNRDGIVLSLNQSARNILHIQGEEVKGRHILALNRNVSLQQAIRSAVDGQKVSESVELSGKTYQLTASPALSDGRVQGVMLLFLDETDKLLAEQQRREFSANVSHELKSPLTSISGYAEIIHNGMAKPEDIREFAFYIFEEANRLIWLVEDIIKLSRLDEKCTQLEQGRVDLLELAQHTVASLLPKAEKKRLLLLVEGEATTVQGVQSILGEVLYNLVENAVHYTEEGSVTVRVGADGSAVTIEVEDTGIGIPLEHQPHVFERFFRVDKSHSRDGGRTGLGLAIVKHGVMFHGGEISLVSEPGKGSLFTVTLPLQ